VSFTKGKTRKKNRREKGGKKRKEGAEREEGKIDLEHLLNFVVENIEVIKLDD